jgi:hypothetical protein
MTSSWPLVGDSTLAKTAAPLGGVRACYDARESCGTNVQPIAEAIASDNSNALFETSKRAVVEIADALKIMSIRMAATNMGESTEHTQTFDIVTDRNKVSIGHNAVEPMEEGSRQLEVKPGKEGIDICYHQYVDTGRILRSSPRRTHEHLFQPSNNLSTIIPGPPLTRQMSQNSESSRRRLPSLRPDVSDTPELSPKCLTIHQEVAKTSPKRPSEDTPEENKVSPKRLSLQFRPDKISSTSTPLQTNSPKIPSKGIRVLNFDQPKSKQSEVKQPQRRSSTFPEPTFCAIQAQESNQPTDCSPPDAFLSPTDQSIIAHGFPSSFFYSPGTSISRSTGARPKDTSPLSASSSDVFLDSDLGQRTFSGRLAENNPFSPSKHPMATRSNAVKTDDDSKKTSPKASLYSLYEALSQVLSQSR